MPELPDLQVFKANLEKLFAGKKLVKVDVIVPRKINVPESTLKSAIEGKKLKSITRNGKELFFQFEGKQVLGMHLMLNGEFKFFEQTNEYRHKIIEFLFSNKTGITLTDWRRGATIRLNPEIPGIADALSKEFSLDFLKAGMSKYKSRRIKELLIDQKFVRGIGNAYADEILWQAKIHPLSKSGSIPEAKAKALYASIRKVLENAEKHLKKNYPGIIGGEKRDFLIVHNSKKKKSPTGAAIIKETIGSRPTYYTNEQVLYKP